MYVYKHSFVTEKLYLLFMLMSSEKHHDFLGQILYFLSHSLKFPLKGQKDLQNSRWGNLGIFLYI